MKLPVKITPSIKCERCTMRYKVIFSECPHCKDKADGPELEEHIENYHRKLKANSKLGMVFLVITSALAAVLVLLVLV